MKTSKHPPKLTDEEIIKDLNIPYIHNPNPFIKISHKFYEEKTYNDETDDELRSSR
ncbi:MAG TPA: hypothetical protein VFX18_03265 [Candidatus Nitrosocosmicus sp.]|nr:hypothetical protein [Candidatus Nitrosocosmicus sp.]